MPETTTTANILNIDYRNIKIDEGFNVRTNLDIDDLKIKIFERGKIIQPLHGYKESTKKGSKAYILTSGHRRLKAIQELHKEGKKIPVKVPLIPESADYSKEERILEILLHNDGKQLEKFEEGEVYRRLRDCEWTEEQIGQKVHRTQAHISQRIKLANAPQMIKNALAKGILNTAIAMKIITTFPPDDHVKEAQKIIDEIKKNGKEKVTAASIKKKGAPKVKKLNSLQVICNKSIEIMETGDKRTYSETKIEKMKAILKALGTKTPETWLKTLMEIF